MTVTTIATGVRLDLGHTDLVGTLVYDGGGLAIVAPSSNEQVLGTDLMRTSPSQVHEAPQGCILIEEIGLSRNLPTALVADGYCVEVGRHRGLSAWGADIVELRVVLPEIPNAEKTLVSANIESE